MSNAPPMTNDEGGGRLFLRHSGFVIPSSLVGHSSFDIPPRRALSLVRPRQLPLGEDVPGHRRQHLGLPRPGRQPQLTTTAVQGALVEPKYSLELTPQEHVCRHVTGGATCGK